MCNGNQEEAYQAEIRRLADLVNDQAGEINRHHRDFAEWEDRAERYQQRAILAEKRLSDIYEAARHQLDTNDVLGTRMWVLRLEGEGILNGILDDRKKGVVQ